MEEKGTHEKNINISINGRSLTTDIVGKTYTCSPLFKGRLETPLDMREQLLLLDTNMDLAERVEFCKRWPLQTGSIKFYSNMKTSALGLGVLCHSAVIGAPRRIQRKRDLMNLLQEYLIYGGFHSSILRGLKNLAELDRESLSPSAIRKYLPGLQRETIEEPGLILRVREQVWVWTDRWIPESLAGMKWADIHWMYADRVLSRKLDSITTPSEE